MRVLLHPISRTKRWTSQLSDQLVHVNGQLYVEPQAVLTSMLQALHVVRGVLQEVRGGREDRSCLGLLRRRERRGVLEPGLLRFDPLLEAHPCAHQTSTTRQDGHVYVVENHPMLRALLREAARSCINPNMWFMESSWPRGMISNAASHRRLFLPAHQPNRR